MKKKVITLCLVGIFILCMLTGCSKTTIRFGTGSTGGNYYACGNTLSALFQDSLKFETEVKTTAGSASNLRLLSTDFLDLAIVQSDTLLDAENGEGEFSDGALSGYSAIASLYTEACQIVVRADSDIQQISDLAGKRVSVGEEDSGVTANAEQILMTAGLTFSDITTSRLSFSESAIALANNEIDAFFCTAGTPTVSISSLSESTEIRLLSLDSHTIEQLTKLYSSYSVVEIPANTYTGQAEAVTTVGVSAVLVANNNLSSEDVSKITECLHENAESISQSSCINLLSTPEEAVSTVPIAFHSGAVSYYQSQGIEVSSNSSQNEGLTSSGQDNG